MIKSDKGHIVIQGDGLDVIFEFNSILGTLAKSHPEVLLAVMRAWGGKLLDSLDNKELDVDKLDAIYEMSLNYIKSAEVYGDE